MKALGAVVGVQYAVYSVPGTWYLVSTFFTASATKAVFDVLPWFEPDGTAGDDLVK